MILGSYRGLFDTVGVPAFVVSAVVARIPMSMLGLAIIMVIAHTTGSYSQAGAVLAVMLVARTVGTIASSRLVDRLGQFRVLTVLAAGHFLGLTGLLLAVQFGTPLPVTLVAAAVTGASRPAIGSMSRARWAYLVKRTEAGENRLQAAFSLESITENVIFIAGPAIVVLLAVQVHPFVALAVCLVFTVGGSLALAMQRSTEPPARHRQGLAGSPMSNRGIQLITGVSLVLGVLFGTVDLVTVAHTEAHGAPAAAGPLLAVLAAGSMVGGLWYGGRQWDRPLPARAVTLSFLLVCTVVPLAFVTGLWPLAAVLLAAGLVLAPLVITCSMLVERLLPAGQLTEGMAWFSAAMACGLALGGAASGALVDTWGTRPGYLLVLGCAALVVAIVTIGSRALSDPVPSRECDRSLASCAEEARCLHGDQMES